MTSNSIIPENSGLPNFMGSAAPSCPQLMDLNLDRTQWEIVNRLLTVEVQDFHHWSLGAANSMRNRGITQEDAFKVLTVRSRAQDRTRFVTSSEIARTVAKAYGSEFNPEEIPAPKEGFACLKAAGKLAALMASEAWPQNYGLKELLAEAPDYSDKVSQLPPAVLLSYLFRKWRGQERFITLGKKKESGEGFTSKTFSLSALNAGYDTEDFNFVVPNLASKISGFTKDVKKSNRCLEMFPDRQYLVLESDMGYGTEDVQAALIKYTMEIIGFRPVMIVHSGSKSLHSWWYVEDLEDPESWVRTFLDQMGGVFDLAAKTRCQLFRLPNGIRREGGSDVLQKVLWVDAGRMVRH